MKAIEVTGSIDAQGNLILDQPLDTDIHPTRVRVIVLFNEKSQEEQELEDDPDDTPVPKIKASLKRAWEQAKAGQRIPLSEMWDGIDVE
ncbi:type II toxin-antitoxin system RelN family antitoxin [Calothrix sp. NIES-3974]|uniref:type II toxin-antitoxin system RelN family antitoxin n=1 Tax=Calothrix sp. NIES-3974 TaxID=2005462 RepID=UPI000B5E0984|nr:hypothetical protein [Calothrix sp. NIES-3974]BAZ05323.1 hypothetical protein NIES3974_19700 [Calothrix sp. NIES-3974]